MNDKWCDECMSLYVRKNFPKEDKEERRGSEKGGEGCLLSIHLLCPLHLPPSSI